MNNSIEIKRKKRIYIELSNEIEFVEYLNYKNLITLNRIVIDQVDEDRKMMCVQVLLNENDRNEYVIDWNVLV